ncbi:MAG: metallophosphoesterase [Oscillospiraceae bacterium]|nr:metallophosphoesterase [Oscillospiraceae bacterium]
MKKITCLLALLLAFAMIFSFAGCGKNPTESSANESSISESSVSEASEVESNEPFFVFVATSDLHVDYGVQKFDPPIRPSTLDAFEDIKALNVNVMALLGDLTSNTTGKGITAKTYDAVITTITENAKAAVSSGRVLFVDGNHDFVAGGTKFNSGNYIKYMTETCGEFVDSIYQQNIDEYVDEGDEGTIEHVLGFHYVIDGVDIIGINTPYEGGDKHSDYYYYPESLEWLDQTLAKIGADKTVIVLGHYPLSDSNNIYNASKGTSNTYNTDDLMHSTLAKYPNAIYLYGHDHGGPKYKKSSDERMTFYDSEGEVYEENVFSSKTETEEVCDAAPGFITAFVGSMAYYDGALGKDDYHCVQSLLISFYKDRIEFQIINHKEPATGGIQDLPKVTVMRDLSQYVK